MSRVGIIVAAFACGGLAPAQDAAPAAALTWADLVARPELRPSTAAVAMDLVFSDGAELPEGTVGWVSCMTDEGFVFTRVEGNTPPFTMKIDQTDIVARANRDYAGLTDELQRLTRTDLVARTDVWPETVTLLRAYDTGEGEHKRAFAAGRELDLLWAQGDRVWLHAGRTGEPERPMTIPLDATDVLGRIRASWNTKPRHRIATELEGKVISLKSGRSATVDPRRPPKYLAIYHSAGWCGPCHRFSPRLVAFYNENQSAVSRKKLQVVFVSRDESEQEMLEYAQQYEFPFLGVRWKDRGAIPFVRRSGYGGIPHLIVFDADGKVVADSYHNGEYLGADAALDRLAELLE